MSQQISTRLQGYLMGRWSDPTEVTTSSTTLSSPISDSVSTPSRTVTYFDEGAGFIFLGSLGEGSDGIASLVHSLEDGQVYVRKEDQDFEDDGEDGLPDEINLANIVQDIPGTITPCGWFRYRAKGTITTFCVTHWKLCNAGDLRHLIRACAGSHILERRACLWLAKMLKTMVALHRKDVAHTDASARNWFVQGSEATSEPEAILGDFGRSMKLEPDLSEAKRWAWMAFRDFRCVAVGIRGLIHQKDPEDTYGNLRGFLPNIDTAIADYKLVLASAESHRAVITSLDHTTEAIADEVETYG